MLTAHSFEEQDDKDLSSALPHPKINRPNPQFFILGEFMSLAENVILNFSTRSRRNYKK